MIVVPLQEEEAIVARRVRETGTGVGVGLEPPYGAVRAPGSTERMQYSSSSFDGPFPVSPTTLMSCSSA